MHNWLTNFITVVLAVLAALFVFQRLQPSQKADVNAPSTLTPTQQIIHDDAMQALNAQGPVAGILREQWQLAGIQRNRRSPRS